MSSRSREASLGISVSRVGARPHQRTLQNVLEPQDRPVRDLRSAHRGCPLHPQRVSSWSKQPRCSPRHVEQADHGGYPAVSSRLCRVLCCRCSIPTVRKT